MVTNISRIGLFVEVGHMPQNYSIEMDLLARFLHTANKRTYANKDVPQVQSSRLKSQDYEFEQDQFTYHDTFFGDRDFIGEQIVYKQDSPCGGRTISGSSLRTRLEKQKYTIFFEKR